jgi:predicted AlkP superfamily pyrophosphatase or phosphodiesterase
MKSAHFTLSVFVCLFGISSAAFCQVDSLQHIAPGKNNSAAQQKKPYVILISADGFRFDYPEKYRPEHLLQMSAGGVRATSMIPSFPSLTFPNHYTIITGLYPSHHGLVNNTFFDPLKKATYTMGNKERVQDGSWYGGTPLWVLADQQQMLSASMFWVGSEAAVKNTHPTYYYDYNEKIPVNKRIETVKNWLQLPDDKRPHLITFYLYEPDHTGHDQGPDGGQMPGTIRSVDSIVHALTEVAAATGLPVNFIFLADHGMTAVDRDQPIRTPSVIDREKFIISPAGTLLMLHAKDKADIGPLYEKLKKEADHYKVYLKTDLPPHYRYGSADDRMNRIGDILLISEWPYVFSDRKPGTGYHGFFARDVKDMHAVFMAWGPAFKNGINIPSFENVHVYPLIADILGLKITEPIDGKRKVLRRILK